ncbi:Pentatricopeptide repeat-containing protein [Acorus calamus]|uniref:Pentatricopeptide repeat-containing protein n=1 Tax=Acorus calamus TaxID=4465 RepID=A0AAV9E2S6_ACOCL|nr:Pentatricopeptide repeat-containing protein [Acorus calamus]
MKGHPIDPATSKSVLDKLLRLGMFDTALEVLDDLEEQPGTTQLDPKLYDSIVVALAKKNQLGLALSIFQKLSDGRGGGSLSLGVPACDDFLVALRKAGVRDEFRWVFERLREWGIAFDERGYNICIHGFGCCFGDLGLALKLFGEMKERSIEPSLCTYNSMLRALFLSGRPSDALVVYEELKASGHRPDGFTYRTVIQGCCRSHRVDVAMMVFDGMHHSGVRPDVVVYNSLIDGLLKARRLTEACGLFEAMVRDDVKASVCTYNVLIDGLFKNGRGVAAYSLFRDLKKKGPFVDSLTYSIVVVQLCKVGYMEDALELVEEMERRGFVVNLVTVTTVLIGLHKSGMWDCAERLMRHFRNNVVLPNVVRWKTDMEASIRAPQDGSFPSRGDLREVSRLIDDDPSSENATRAPPDEWSSSPHMDHLAGEASEGRPQAFIARRGRRVADGGGRSFDADMINTYVSIFISKGKLNVACKLFEVFTGTGSEAMGYAYNALMSSFVKQGSFAEAWGVLKHMGERLCPADIATYSVVVHGLGKLGEVDLAKAVVEQLTKRGGYVDVVMHNTMIRALGKAGRIEEAEELLKEMLRCGVNPDVITFNALIEMHAKVGRVKEAYRFLKLMLDVGCSPNHGTDAVMDSLLMQIEKLSVSIPLDSRRVDDLESNLNWTRPTFNYQGRVGVMLV